MSLASYLAAAATTVGLTVDQLLTLLVIVGTIVAFVWNRIRHDIVAFAALLACVLLGLTPADTAFKGFGNHAVVLVVFVLILSHGFQRSGAIDSVSHWLVTDRGSAFRGVVVFTLFGAVLAAFITNIGALALLMPLGLQFAQRNALPPALVLIPMSYGTIFGGMVTLIGSPANLLVSGFREDELGSGFAMFDFLGVGAAAGAVALVLVLALSRLLIPRRAVRNAQGFETSDYQTEARVGPASRAAGRTVREIEAAVSESGARVIGLAQGNARSIPPPRQIVREGDILVIEASPTTLPGALARLGLVLEEEVVPAPAAPGATTTPPQPRPETADDMLLTELAVLPGARLVGRSAREIRLRGRYGLNLLAVSRAGRHDPRRLRDMTIVEGDVLLVQGSAEDIADFANDHGCAPLADRPLRLPRPRRMVLALAILLGAVAVSASGLLPTAVAYGCAALLAILTGVTPARSVPGAVDWSVVVLLGALIPVANAVESTGLAEVAARAALEAGGEVPDGAFLIGVLIVASMVLTNVLNNAAAVAIMAPVAFSISRSLEVGPDPLLIAVAVGAQSGFLTPIGHQSNTLILLPSGLRFWDFWQLGLPLQAAVLAVTIPAILFFWPM